LSRESCFNSQATVCFSKRSQFSVSISMETVFRNQLVSRKQSLHGNVFAHSLPRNGPRDTIFSACDGPQNNHTGDFVEHV
jgi:hypothetical protein